MNSLNYGRWYRTTIDIVNSNNIINKLLILTWKQVSGFKKLVIALYSNHIISHGADSRIWTVVRLGGRRYNVGKLVVAGGFTREVMYDRE